MNDFFFGNTAQDVFNRLKFILNATTARELAQKLEMTESGISNAITRNSIPYRQCAKVALTHKIPMDWLVFGDVDNKKFSRSLDPELFKRTYSQTFLEAANGSKEPIIFNNQELVFINLFSMDAERKRNPFKKEHAITQIPFNKGWIDENYLDTDKLICLKNKGINMQPDINDADIVLINQDIKKGDGIYAINLNDTISIKRIQWLANGLIRLSCNQNYAPETIDPMELDQFTIIGICHSRISVIAQ